MNPSEEHAANLKDYQDMLKGDDGSGGAVMTIQGQQLPCTHTQLVQDFQMIAGQSSTTFIESIQFLDSDVPDNVNPSKGDKFTLKMNPSSAPIALKLWHGGLLRGGLIWRFMAVDANYKG